MAGFTSHTVPPVRARPTRRTHREVPRRARRARRCRRLGCPQPPGPPERPGPRRPAHRGERRRTGALHLRLRDLGARHAQRAGQRRGPRAGQRPAARRHLPQPPGQAGRHGARRSAGLADLRLGAVQPADDAGRGLPGAARHAGRHRHRRQRGLRPRRRPGRHRRRPRRHAPRADRRADRDRRLDDLAAGHRPVPALAPRARLEPAHARTSPRPRWSRPACSATPPSR